ncbi:DUF4876 domain-containing protein [Chishuiella changwenlii]|uniref:DUF4876 domain-containing protein n=1 Tax=Chishuiella changwenlii TaxID=1434701 RepID=UPI002FDB489C
MQKLLSRFGLLTVLSAFLLFSCNNNDDEVIGSSSVTYSSKLPDGVQSAEIIQLNYTFKELNTGKVSEHIVNGNKDLTVDLPTGSYEVSVSGQIKISLDGSESTEDVVGYISSEAITSTDKNKTIQLFIKVAKGDLILEELFFTGTLSPEGKQYNGDKYFKIYNNSDETLYADGLLIVQSEFLTVEKQEYRPNIMATDFAAGAIIMLPGNGKDFPIEPGKSIIVAEDAINHKELNPNSIDLRTADFEIYNDDMDDVDNPSVKNTLPVFSNMIMHNRGFTSYVLARLPQGTNIEQYLAQYDYTYEYDFVFGEDSFPMSNDAYRIPNDWIIDAVNLSVNSEFQWIVTAPSLDAGWTYSGTVDRDSNRYGKGVRRKTLSTSANGNKILVDTNNSTRDFSAQVKPSLFN